MRVNKVKELFQKLTAEYFSAATVVFANQSRQPKGKIPLVVINCGNVNRPQHINYDNVDGTLVGNYLSRLSVTVDLFTNGLPVIDEETGETVAYADSALDDILSFADFVSSEYAIGWCDKYDISISLDGDAQNLTGVVNDTSYEYRSRLSFFVYFTQKTIDAAAVASEESILYPSTDGIYTPEIPIPTTSTTGGYGSEEETAAENSVVEKKFITTPSGGGSVELTGKTVGYFTEAEVKEIREEK